MRLENLDLDELLELDPRGGMIRFSGQRALILDAVALGLLRRQLVESLGWAAARAILWRFGYAHGWRTAESLRDEIPWESEADWRRAGGRLHTLQGLVRVEPLPSPPAPEPFAHALWRDSYEAEQHLLHLGRSPEPVCWTLTGFASGYLSFANGRELLCREERCAGMGHPACHLVGRPREEWARLEPGVEVAPVAAADSLGEALAAVSGELRRSAARAARRREEPDAGEPPGLVARSEAMRRVVHLARRVARADAAVLVTGESGAGKERVARLVHGESGRAA
ncbi:MAG TPA: XylR N-terminal domain-containing protein, partial [Anaeromyxobacteraceae bacterium]